MPVRGGPGSGGTYAGIVVLSPPPRPAPGVLRRMATFPLRIGPCDSTLQPTPFLRLALLHACSSAGDALVTVALAGSVFVSVSLHAARGRTAIGLLCTVLPFVIVGPFVGPRIDGIRGGRRAVVALSCAGRAAACLVMVHVLHSLWLFPAAFASLVCSKTYLVAKASLVPGAVASDEDLVTANSRLAVGSSIVTSIAAVLGALIYRAFGSAAVLYLDVLVLLAGAVLAAGVRPGRPVPTGLRVASVVAAPAPAVVDDRPQLPPGGLAAAAAAMATMRGMAGLMTALIIFAFRHQGAPLVWYGLVGVASVAGNLGGAAAAPPLRAHVREDRLVPACAMAIGILALAMTQVSVLRHRPAALVLGAGVGFGASIAKLAFDALVQREVPDMRRGRRFAQYETVFQLSWVAAALVPVLITLPLQWGFVAVAASTLGGAAVFWTGLARARRAALPSWWPDAVRQPAGNLPGFPVPGPAPAPGWAAHIPAPGEPPAPSGTGSPGRLG